VLVPKEPLRRQQHLVSKGYQRNFADGQHLAILDVQDGAIVDARRSIECNWRMLDFVSIVTPDGVDDTLERRFSKDERVVLNVIREISPRSPVSPRQKGALDKLAAIHLVRSLSFAGVHATVVKGWLESGALNIAQDPRAIALFTDDRGRPPVPGELEAIVAASAQQFARRPDLLAGGMTRGREAIPAILAKSSVQLVSADDSLPGFVLPDHPVLHGKLDEGVFGFRNAGAIGDADLIALPIHRRLVAFYSRQRLRNMHLRTRKGVNVINALLVRSAATEVACHPDDALVVSRLIKHLDRYPAQMLSQGRLQ
jgi:hypothetical protein